MVQWMPQILIDPHFCVPHMWLNLFNIVFWPNWMPQIPWFWVVVMVVIQSRSIVLCFPPNILHSKSLLTSTHLCWVRCTCQIEILGVNCIFVGSIFSWWRTSHIVYGYIISWLTQWWQLRCTDGCQPMMTRFHSIQQVVNTQYLTVTDLSILVNIVDCEPLVISVQIILFC